jgi:hypothetical protein
LKGPAHVVEESCTHINIQQKNPNFQTSNPTPKQLEKVDNLHIQNCNFHLHPQIAYKNHTWISGKNTNASKKAFAFSTYKMQVVAKKKTPTNLRGI